MKIIFFSFLFLLSCVPSLQEKKTFTYFKEKQVALELDLVLPNEGIKPYPVVFLVHGGSWKRGSKSHMNNIANKLVKEGFAVINMCYRLAPQFHFPAPIEDVQKVLEWTKNHAQKYNLDLNRLNFWGYSAGSQISTYAALKFSNEYSIKAIINGAGPMNLSLFPKDPNILNYLGTKDPNVFTEASPISLLTKDSPPVFSYHSPSDSIVDFKHAKQFHARLEELKVENYLHEVPFLGHVLTFLCSKESIQKSILFLKIHNESK